MNKTFTQLRYVVLGVFLTLTTILIAQSEQAPAGLSGPMPQPTVSQAQWDILFDYDIGTSSGQAGLAGGVHMDSIFWTAVWNEDTIAVFNNDGTFIENFTLPELFNNQSGFIRAMTWDGTSVWAGNNTTTIHEIDPATKTVVNSISTSSPDEIRFITYDESADGGNGGFWVGNFNTPIYLISRTGALLTTIPIETHQLGGMYGAAYDDVSVGGPYLWVYHQAGDPSDGLITQLDLTTGTATGIGRDVNQDLNTPEALAGGLFITNRWDDEGTLILGGVNQTFPGRLFGYELSFDPAEALDLITEDITAPVSTCGLTNAENVSFEIINVSSESVSNVPVELLINNEVVASEIAEGPLLPNTTFTYTFNATVDMSGIGVYQVGARTVLSGDINNSNNFTTNTIANKSITAPELAQDFDGLAEGVTLLPSFYNLGTIAFEVSPGPTPSANTGPATDASGSGNFIFMETSGSLPLEQAILSTECLDLTGFDNMELEFSYHMFGNAIGDLLISVRDAGGTTSIIDFISGQQQATSDAPWEKKSVSLADYAGQTVEVIITGNVADNGEFTFNADIALDEIILRNCIAPVIEAEVTDVFNNNQGGIDLTITNGTAPYTYLWSNGETTEDLTDVQSGDYTVEVTDGNGCTFNDTFTVGSSTAIENIDELQQFSISPNPTAGQLQVALELDQMAAVQLTVFDAIGQEVHRTKVQHFAQHIYQLDLTDQASGMYWISLRINDEIITRSISLK